MAQISVEPRIIDTSGDVLEKLNEAKMQRNDRFYDAVLGNSPLLIKQMKDYCTVGMSLFWQRQMIFGAALVMAAFYYSVELAVICGALLVLAETSDFFVYRMILKWDGTDRVVAKRFLVLLCVGTVFSAGIISFYAIGISYLQGPTAHFMPLFFLFAAALFAAMNNHQLLPVLAIRIIMYGITFLLVPISDILRVNPGIHSELWAQLFTSIFVLYFIIDCSRIYMKLYRSNISKIQELAIENEKGKLALKAKSEFLATMSHELRTPLTSIKGTIDLVHSGRLGDPGNKIQSVIGIAHRNCTRLMKLVDEILDLQKMESGKLNYKFENLDICEVVREAVDVNRPYAEKLGIKLVTYFEEKSIFVSGDRARLEQVCANILSNAAKFSPEHGDVTVRVKSVSSKVHIEFIDQGVGLSEDDKEKVFERFSQIDSSDTRKIGGTGLGMNISQIIVKAHGGRLDYRKNKTVGTTFFIDLEKAPTNGDLVGKPDEVRAA